MSKSISQTMLTIMKTTLITGYAVSLFVPYRVEKKNGETTYHAPLYKLSYKTSSNFDEEQGSEPETVHTYTFTSFGLLADQIHTAKRLYKVAMLKKPYIKEQAENIFEHAADKISGAVSNAKKDAVQKASGVKTKMHGIEQWLTDFVEDIIE